MIRLAQSGEAATIAAVVTAAYEHYVARMGRKPGPMLDDFSARIAAGEAWVLEQSGIVGVLVLVESEGGLLLDNVALLPTAQGMGLGRQLMSFAEDEARRRGFTAIRLYTHVTMVENQALYRRLGYVETGRGTEAGFERVFMTKDVEEAVATPL